MYSLNTTRFYKIQFVLIIQIGKDKKKKQDVVESWEREKRSPVKKESFSKRWRGKKYLQRKGHVGEKISKATKDKCPRL